MLGERLLISAAPGSSAYLTIHDNHQVAKSPSRAESCRSWKRRGQGENLRSEHRSDTPPRFSIGNQSRPRNQSFHHRERAALDSQQHIPVIPVLVSGRTGSKRSKTTPKDAQDERGKWSMVKSHSKDAGRNEERN